MRLEGDDEWPGDWMNLNDILPVVGLTSDFSRRNGCCGLDGCDGPNRICSCGNHVGTERSDCWMPHSFMPLEDGTIWIEERNA